MKDEELKNKCTERAKIFQQAIESCKSSNPIDCIEWFADRIAELEKDNRLLEQRGSDILKELLDKNKRCMELEQQIEKMKCCGNCKHCKYSESEESYEWCEKHDQIVNIAIKPCYDYEMFDLDIAIKEVEK